MSLILLATAKLLAGISRRVTEMAGEELFGEDKIKQELLELQMRLELDEISEQEYVVREAALMERLEEGRRRRGEGGAG